MLLRARRACAAALLLEPALLHFGAVPCNEWADQVVEMHNQNSELPASVQVSRCGFSGPRLYLSLSSGCVAVIDEVHVCDGCFVGRSGLVYAGCIDAYVFEDHPNTRSCEV